MYTYLRIYFVVNNPGHIFLGRYAYLLMIDFSLAVGERIAFIMYRICNMDEAFIKIDIDILSHTFLISSYHILGLGESWCDSLIM